MNGALLRLLAVSWLFASTTLCVQTSPNDAPRPARLRDCAARAIAGQTMCVCGDFPADSGKGLVLDGSQLLEAGEQASHTVEVRLPETVTPGLHVISGNPQYGFSPSDQFLVLVVRVQGKIDRNALLRGESTTMRLSVLGTSEPLRLALTNRTPSIVALEGGDSLVATSSGGSPNLLMRRVRGIGRGDFQIDYRLEAGGCPCAAGAGPPAGPVPPGQRDAAQPPPPRILALITLATPQVMAATAQALASTHTLVLVEVAPLASINAGLAVFTIPDGTLPAVKVAALAGDPRVQLAQEEVSYTTTGDRVESYSDIQYGPRLIGADRLGTGFQGDGVRIALIDTGVDTSHRQLRGKIVEQVDVTGKGFGPDIHGTLIAGILAADPRHGPGLQGIAPRARLLAIKACEPVSPRALKAECWSTSLAKGMDIALRKKARVINLSVGGPRDRLLERIINEAVRKGVAVAAAAGNDGPEGTPPFPAALDHVLAVTAVDARERLYPYATQGEFIDLAAPGVEILSTSPGNNIVVFSGTSAAAAYVSGALALIAEKHPTFSLKTAKNVLEGTARDLGPAGKDRQFGAGLLDICQATRRLLRKPDCR